MRLVPVLLLALLAASMPLAAQGPRDARQLEIDERWDRVLVLEMSRGQRIDDALYVRLRDEIEAAAGLGRTAIVIQIDSPGGEVNAAANICEMIRAYREHPDVRIFAYVAPGREAISAGAWIALGCKGLLIAPDASIGDIQPIEMGFGAYRDVEEKVVTKTAQDVWLAARENGLRATYPELFVRAMVDKDLDIYAVRNPRLDGSETFMRASEFRALNPRDTEGLTVEEITLPGKALTTSGRDLLRFGFRVRLVGDRDGLLDLLGTPDAKLEVVDVGVKGPSLPIALDWSFLLLVAGIILVGFEFHAPGLGIFGVLGLLALVGFFLIQADFGSSAVLPIALLLVGILLILVEAVLLPGLILPGLLGLFMVLYSTWLAIARRGGDSDLAWPDLSSEEGRRTVVIWAGSLVGAGIAAIGANLLLGPRLHRIPVLGKIVIVPPRTHGPAGAEGGAAAAGGPAVGGRGRAETDLRPSGRARVEGRALDVVSRGEFIERGTTVEILEIRGNRVVVRAVAPESVA
ncbi:MAG: NfeD family protein [Planctomycetota bacterium]